MIEEVPFDLVGLETLDVSKNPLSTIPAVFRDDMIKVLNMKLHI